MRPNLEPFEQTVSEINQRFQKNREVMDNWEITQSVMSDIGGIAVNVCGTNLAGDEPGWARSSMSDTWLERYESKKYHLVDPFLAALVAGRSEVMTDCGTLLQSDPAWELNHDLRAHGYVSLYGSMSGSTVSGCRSLVVFCSDQTLAQVDSDIGFERLKIIHALIAANIPVPYLGARSGQIPVRGESLTPKEHDILCWLASGLRNDQIAFKSNIAEVTVRKYLLSIRQKLGAATREQAIAIAVRDGWITL